MEKSQNAKVFGTFLKLEDCEIRRMCQWRKNLFAEFFNNEINRPTTASQTLLQSTPAAYDPLAKMVPKIAFSKFGKKFFFF